MIKVYLVYSILFILFLITGCTKLEKDLPAPTSGAVKIHEYEWLDTKSKYFHGKYLGNDNFSLDQCKSCHGNNYISGNITGKSCIDANCHVNEDGPEACNTCHGNFNDSGLTAAAPPKSIAGDTSTLFRGVGAHQKHLMTGTLGKSVKCSECHIVPSKFEISNHINIPFNIQIIFNDTLARLKTNNNTIIPNPVFDSLSLRCSNSYCHGYFKNGNLTNSPTWNKVVGTQASCGTCHGNAEAGDPRPTGTVHLSPSTKNCQTCHTTENIPVATHDSGTNTWTISDRKKHINGKLSRFGAENSF